MEIKEGMIGFSGGNEFMQKAIRFFIGSKFSHTFTVIRSPYGEESNKDHNIISVIETTSTLVSMTPFHRKDNEDNYIEMYDVIADSFLKTSALEETYIRFSGKWYGYLSYFWFIYRWFMRKLFNKEPKQMWDWCNKGITCTELTCNYLYLLFPEIFEGYDLNILSPDKLKEIINKNPNKFIYLGWYKP